MSEPCLTRTNAPRPLDSLIDGCVAGMRLVAKRGDDEMIEPFKQRKTRFGDGVHIGEISDAAKAEARNLLLAVQHGYAIEFDAVNQGAVGERLQPDARAVRISGFGRECVVVDAFENFTRLRRCIKRYRTRLAIDDEAQRAQVVEAEDMIRVAVRVEHRVHAPYAAAQCLLAEVRTGIDDDDALAHALAPAQKQRWAQAAVARIGRRANGAIAAQGGNAHRR